MGDNHFANISVKFSICLSNVYYLICLMGNLRLFLINNFELINIGERMAFGSKGRYFCLCGWPLLPKAIHSPMLINSKLLIRKSLKLPMRQKRQYTFERQILNLTEMLAKWLSPMYSIPSWV